MEITNELLAAYAEGNVTPEERKAVREYLTEHPSQLESVMMMMDDDYGMEVESKTNFSWLENSNPFSEIAAVKEISQQDTLTKLIIKGTEFTRKLANKYVGQAKNDRSFSAQLDKLFDDINNF